MRPKAAATPAARTPVPKLDVPVGAAIAREELVEVTPAAVLDCVPEGADVEVVVSDDEVVAAPPEVKFAIFKVPQFCLRVSAHLSLPALLFALSLSQLAKTCSQMKVGRVTS